jgi:hypothetical protein
MVEMENEDGVIEYVIVHKVTKKEVKRFSTRREAIAFVAGH